MAVGMTYMGFLSALPPEVVLGSFTGSVIFLLGVTNKPKWQWMLYFTIAFMAGLLSATAVSEIITGILGICRLKVVVPVGMGAMVSAACTVNIIGWFRDNPAFFMLRKSGDKV